MISLQSVEMHNYGSYQGRHVIQLGGLGLTCVLGRNFDELRMGSNGTGKSTLFDAIDWCLFGAVPRGDTVDSVINDVAGSDCIVGVHLTDDEHRIFIKRWRGVGGKKDGVVLGVDAEDQTALDVDETQKAIQRCLGLDRDVFHAAVLFAQEGRFKFCEAGDADRLKILSKVLQLGQIDDWLIKAKELFQKNKDAITAKEAAKAANAAVLSRMQYAELDNRIAAFEADRQRKIQGYKSSIEQSAAESAALRRTYEVRKGESDAFQNIVAPDMTGFTAQLEKLQFEIEALDPVVAGARAEHMKWGAEYQRIMAVVQKMRSKREGVCFECGQMVTGEHVAKELVRLSAELDAANSAMQQAQQQWGAIEGQRKQKMEEARGVNEAMAAAKAVYDGQWVRAQNLVRELDGWAVKIQRVEEAAKRAVAEIAREESAVNPYRQQVEDLRAQEASVKAEINKQETELVWMREEGKHIDFWVRAFGITGLKNYILDTKLQEINDEANKWVRLLTGGTIWVRIETQTMGRSTETLRNKTAVRVFKYHPDGHVSERGYRSWSGGEKQRVALAVDFGLSRLIASRADKQWSLLLLDEVFQHLDGPGRSAVMELLIELRKDRDTILVVDHDAEFLAQFENRIFVGKRNRCSSIISEDDFYGVKKEGQSEGQKANPEKEGDHPSGGNVGQSSSASKRGNIQRKPVVPESRNKKAGKRARMPDTGADQ